MKKILIFSPWARYTPHFETDLELIQKHLDAGDEVHFMGCDAELLSCDRNPRHDLVRCNMCIGRRDAGLGIISGAVTRVPLYFLNDDDRGELAALPKDFPGISELKEFRVDRFDAGYAVLSSMVSFLRDPDPFADENRGCLHNLLVASVAVYRSFQNHLDRGKYDRVYIFNGRFAITRAVLRACQSRGIDCYTHERGHDHRHYALFPNTTIHDLDYSERAIRASWENAADSEERDRIGAQFYHDRAKGREQAWFSFVQNQKAGLLPDGYDIDAENVVIFNSSQDEFVAIGDSWQNPIYESQELGVDRIAASLLDSPGIRLYLRVHPNLAKLNNEQTRKIAGLSSNNLTVIPAESTVSSYALLKNARKVITFGSTLGIEAVFWGVPSILAGQSLYRALGGVYTPQTHEELVEMVRGELPPGPREPALMYGYHRATFGTPYRYYKPAGVFKGRFNGHAVRPDAARLGAAVLLKLASPVERLRRRKTMERIRSRLLK